MKRTHHTIRTAALAVALAFPASFSLAAPLSEIVTTRDDQSIDSQFGRDSVYAIQTRQPADSGPRHSSDGSSGVGEFFAGLGAAGVAAWDSVTGAFEPVDARDAQREPEVYGRAGGYVGGDQIALLERADPAPAIGEIVTTRESLAANEPADTRYPAATEDQLYGRDRRFQQYEQEFQHSAPAATTGEWPASAEMEQSAPSPDAGSVEDRAEFDGTTAAPADGGDWKQPDEADAVTSGGGSVNDSVSDDRG
jgi:hypothetical protein